jgi:hypothetical protein
VTTVHRTFTCSALPITTVAPDTGGRDRTRA